MSSIDPVVSEEKMFENVDGRMPDAGVTGILIAHLGAFGSGELKSVGININSPGFLVSDKKILFCFPYISLCKTFDPPGGTIFCHRSII